MKKNEFLVEEYVAPCVEVVEVVVERGFAESPTLDDGEW